MATPQARWIPAILGFVFLATSETVVGAAEPQGVAVPGTEYTRVADVIYRRKHGVALTMDVLIPPKPNGAAVIWAVSSGFNSHHAWVEGPKFAHQMSVLLDRGYIVFGVVHGSVPRFTVPEFYADIRRAIRYIRHHAKDYGVDPNRIGIAGASAGGVLSLMMGAAPEDGDSNARDPVDRESTRLQAVGCFYPASDLVNFAKEGDSVLRIAAENRHLGAYKFHELDAKTGSYVPITDEKRIGELLREYSPLTHASAGDTPTLIVHGDGDKLVPILQASKMIDKLTAAGVKAKLVVAKGRGHYWPDQWTNEMNHIADWFDVHLAKPK